VGQGVSGLPAVVTCGCASRRTKCELTQGLPQKVDFQTLASAPCPSISSGAATMVLPAIVLTFENSM